MAPSRRAASRTRRAIGPAESWLAEIGMMPRPETRPTVGFMPTRQQTDEGLTIEPSVSVPTAAGARPAAGATPEPELEPAGERSSTYGFRVWRPRPLQPLDEAVERKFAHSARLVLPSRTAPASRRLASRGASRAAGRRTS